MFLLAEGIDLLICCLCNCFYKKKINIENLVGFESCLNE